MLLKQKSLKRIGAGLAVSAALLGSQAALNPAPADAGAGFMGNSWALAKSNKSLNPTVLGAFGLMEFICYILPPIWLVFTIGGLLATSNNRDEGGMKMVGTISIIWLLVMAMLWWYDSSAVPSAGGNVQATNPMLELYLKSNV